MIHRLLQFIPLLVVAAATATRLSYCVDDGYIFVRVAQNIGRGLGWSFNPYEPVNAMTSVLWTVVLIPLARLDSVPPAALAVLFGVCVLVMAIGVSRIITEPSSSALGTWTAAACAACPTLWDSVGLETALEAALVVWTVQAYASRRDWLAGSLLGLAVLGRPDAGLLGALLVAHGWLSERRLRWRLPVTATALVLPWCAYAYHTFGGILPITLKAKLTQSTLGWWGIQPPFAVAALLSDNWPLAAAAVVVLALIVAGRAYAAMPAPALLLVAYGLAHVIAYSMMRAPVGYFWYYVPFHLSLIVAAAWGAFVLVRHLHNKVAATVGPNWLALRPGHATSAVAMLAIPLVVLSLGGEKVYRHTRQYREAAEYVRGRAAPSDTVAAVEIGYIGYYSQQPVLDIHALIHPQATDRIARGESTWWMERHPRFVIAHDPGWYGEPFARETPPDLSAGFARDHRQSARFPIDKKNALVVWERR